MVNTNIFATKDELADLRSLARAGWQRGDVMMVSSVMEGITKDQKTVDAEKLCHKLAIAHGLPEIKGYYGITNDGEFVRF